MEHLSLHGAFFRILMGGMGDFEAVFVLNSNGSWSVKSQVLTLENHPIQSWSNLNPSQMLSKLSRFQLEKAISFTSIGHTFYIVDKNQMQIALEFFEKHMNHLREEPDF
jgi:hypothetical protein